LTVPGAGAGATTTGRVGQGAIAVGASHRADGSQPASQQAFCWLAGWLAVNQSTPRAFTAHRAQRPSPADAGVDQIRNKKLQIHACAHKRVSVFTVTDHRPPKGPFWRSVSVRLSID